jgi:two-component system NtrC family sensor kinase
MTETGPDRPPRRGLSVATRIFLSFAAIVAAFSLASAFTLVRMGTLRASVTVLWKELVPTTNQLRILSRQIKSVEEFLGFRRAGDLQWLQQALPGLEPFGGQYGLDMAASRLREIATGDSVVATEAQTIGAVAATLEAFASGRALIEAAALSESPDALDNSSFYKAFVARLLTVAQEGRLDAASPETAAMVRVLRRINRELNEAVKALGGPVRQLDLRIEEEQRTSTIVAIGIALAALLLALVLLALVQATLRPIRRLREGSRRIAAGDYAERVDIGAADEIGELAAEFNTMAASLQARDEALAAKQQELLRAERLAAIGRLSSQITHEIRNPLSSIGLNAELLEDEIAELRDPSRAQSILHAIAREVERLKGITEDYLQFARAPRSELTVMNPYPVVVQLLVFIEREARMADVTMMLEPSEGDLAERARIHADPQQVRQALINIVKNAIEAVRGEPAPRVIRVAMRVDGPFIDVAVSDNGPGIRPEIRDRLFEPFVSDKSGGTGLGLALTRDIVVAHGGEIRVESPLEGDRGTCIHLRWRRATDLVGPASGSAGDAGGPGL